MKTIYISEKWLILFGGVAISFGNTVFISKQYWQQSCEIDKKLLLLHEEVHLQQFKKYGFFKYVFKYVFNRFFRFKMEMEAYATEINELIFVYKYNKKFTLDYYVSQLNFYFPDREIKSNLEYYLKKLEMSCSY
jgi:hypothetical protein